MKTEIFPAEKDEMSDDLKTIERTVLSDYKYGFVTDIEADEAPKGLSEDTIRFISAKKNEPAWMLEWRLKAFPLLAHT
jgi:Fe-S cluster assembly protein SufB